MYTFEELVEGFRELGVKEGDTLLVHSSYKSLGEVDGGPATVVRALEAVLGTDKDGTLIMVPSGLNAPEPGGSGYPPPS